MLHHRILEADQDINAGVMSERWVTGRRGVSTQTEIRNSNLEVLNKHELIKHEIKPRAQFGTFWNFGFILDFDIRYSELRIHSRCLHPNEAISFNYKKD